MKFDYQTQTRTSRQTETEFQTRKVSLIKLFT